jgi:hypothetical protein
MMTGFMAEKVAIPYVLRTRFANGIASLHAFTVKQVRTILMAALAMIGLRAALVMTNSSGSRVVTTLMAALAMTSCMGAMRAIGS